MGPLLQGREEDLALRFPSCTAPHKRKRVYPSKPHTESTVDHVDSEDPRSWKRIPKAVAMRTWSTP